MFPQRAPGSEPAGSAPPAVGAPSARGTPPIPPVLAEVERLLDAGRTAEAVLLAYRTAEDDVRRAFGMNLPAQWTHREFLAQYLRRDMGYLAELLPQLYASYEPVRYGPPASPAVPHLLDVLRALYQEPALRHPPPAPRTTAGPSRAPHGSGTSAPRRT